MVKETLVFRARAKLVPWQRNLWVIVVVEVLAILAFQAGFILIPYYIQDMGITDVKQVSAWTGAYQSVGAIGFAVSTPLWGILGDRHGRKLMLAARHDRYAVVLGLTGLVRNPVQLLAVRALQGFFTGTPAAASALVATGTPKERMAFALGMVQTALFRRQFSWADDGRLCRRCLWVSRGILRFFLDCLRLRLPGSIS